jgi:hypothetical protein
VVDASSLGGDQVWIGIGGQGSEFYMKGYLSQSNFTYTKFSYLDSHRPLMMCGPKP